MKKVKIKIDFEGTQEDIDKLPLFLDLVIIKTVDDDFPPIYKVHINFEQIISEYNIERYLSELSTVSNIKKYCYIENFPNAFRFIMNATNIYIDKIFYSKEEFGNYEITKTDDVSDEIWETVLWDIKNRDYAEFHYSNFTGFFKKEY